MRLSLIPLIRYLIIVSIEEGQSRRKKPHPSQKKSPERQRF
jgi:hypothetical protein